MSEINEIYNEIGGAAATESALNGVDISGDTSTSFLADVTNGSVVGRFRIIAWLVAVYCFFQRTLWRTYRKDVEALALDGHYGTKRWWVRKALEYQPFTEVVFTDNDAYFLPVVPELRIVTHAAVVESAYKVILKVAKSNGGTGLIALTQQERIGLQDYCDEIKPTVQVEVRSSKPDLVRVVAAVITDAKLGNANIQSNVELAINTYLRTLDFNGAIRRTMLKLAILAVPGVLDVDIQSIHVKISANSPWMMINLRAITYSGHAVISSEFPLDQTLTYISQNV